MDNVEVPITQPTRVKNFAAFFKNYMSIWSVVVAALPIPLTAFNLIPVYTCQKEFLCTYTTLFCFLILGFIFYTRHRLAKFLFPAYYYTKQREFLFSENANKPAYDNELITPNQEKEKEAAEIKFQEQLKYIAAKQRRITARAGLIDFMPLLFIMLSILFVVLYHNELALSIYANASHVHAVQTPQQILQSTWTQDYRLMCFYLGIFVFAETAFILMAIKEYLQDLLHISDEDLMLSIFHSQIQSAKP